MSIIFDLILISLEGCFKLHTVLSKKSSLQIKQCLSTFVETAWKKLKKDYAAKTGLARYARVARVSEGNYIGDHSMT